MPTPIGPRPPIRRPAFWLPPGSPAPTPNQRLWLAIAAITFLGCQFIPDFTPLTRLLLGGVIAGAIAAFGVVIRYAPSGLLWVSLALHAVLAIGFMGLAALPASTSSALGLDNALKRTRGWDAAATEIFAKAEALGATAVLVDEREVWHGLDYYSRARTLPLLSWRRYGGAKSFAERVPLEGKAAERVLVASLHPRMRPRLRSDFARFESIGEVSIPLGVRSNGCPLARRFHLYLAEDYARQPRTPEWEDKYQGQDEFKPAPCPAPDA